MSTLKSDYASIFGARLKSARKEKGVTQDELAKMANIAKDTLSRYERGNIMPSVEIAVRLGNALKISVAWLIDGEKNINQSYNEQNFIHDPIEKSDIHLENCGFCYAIIAKNDCIYFRSTLKSLEISKLLENFTDYLVKNSIIDEKIEGYYRVVSSHIADADLVSTIDIESGGKNLRLEGKYKDFDDIT